MTIIRITEATRNTVIHAIKKTYDSERELASSIDVTGVGDKLYSALLGKTETSFAGVPDGFLNIVYKLAVVGIHRDSTPTPIREYSALTLPLSKGRPWPIEAWSGFDGVVKSTFSWDKTARPESMFLISCPAISEFEVVMNTRQDAIDAVTVKTNTLVDGVGKMLIGRSTLNAAVKDWPPLLSLLPAFLVDKLNEKSTRPVATQQKASGSVDIDTINDMTSLVAAKLLSGGL